MTAPFLFQPLFRQFDSAGLPAAGYRLWTFAAGTTTPKATYSDAAGTVPNSNPVVLDTTGSATIRLGTGSYNLVFRDPTDVTTIWSEDDYQSPYLAAADIGAALYPQTDAELAAMVTPTNYVYPPGAFRRYGILPTVTDCGPLLNQALSCNSVVYDDDRSGPNVFFIQTTVRFQADGQRLDGMGGGESGVVAKTMARTRLQWTGSAGGTLISFYNPGAAPAQHFSDCIISNLQIDGNALASIGVEGYNAAVTSGAFRNRFEGVGIINVTNGATPYGAFMGSGTINANSNDYRFYNCFFQNCTNGLIGGGATQGLYSTTFSGCTGVALTLTTGGYCVTDQCVFSTNGWDIKTNAGCYLIEKGSWFEDSTNGIYQANTSHSLSMYGSRLHTSNATVLIDYQHAAGDVTIIGCYLGPTSVTGNVVNHNTASEYNYSGSTITPDFGYRQRMLYTGAGQMGLARIDNAGFLVTLTAAATAATGDGTIANLSASAVTKAYDWNGAVNAATGVFTAPVSGPYTFTVRFSLSGVLVGHTLGVIFLNVSGTSAQIYEVGPRFSPGAVKDSAGFVDMEGSITTFLTAGDLAYPSVQVSGSTKVIQINAGGPGLNYQTRFSGKLA